MKNLLAALALALASPALGQFCPSCIQNSASAQNAQFNISSATIRGPLTVGSISMSSITVSTANAGVFVGSGTYLTNLNASQILLGTVPSARVAGAYSGITGLGTVASGVWNGTVIGTQYGGTGQNFSAAATGAIPYFSGTGALSAFAPSTLPAAVLQQNSVGALVWASSPTVSGANVSNIPLANLQTGTLPTAIAVADGSLSTVSGSKISGNISGSAANITGNLPIAQIAPGTLPTDVPASSITVTGVTPGYWGGSGQAMLINIQTDGRIASITQSTYTVATSSIAPGTLPAGVYLPANQVLAGSLLNTVIASSVAASGVTAGSYVGTEQIPQLTVGVDGRLTSVTQANIALPLTQLNSGTLPSGVLVPAANINAGSLGSDVVASSVAANGVVPGEYGSSTYIPRVTVGADGRITAISSTTAPGGTGAFTGIDNNWSATQTFQSSVTINSSLSATAITATAGGFTGIGSGLTNLNPASMQSGVLPGNVIASSVAASGVTTGEYGSSSYIPQVTVGVDGRVVSISSTQVTATITGIVGGDLYGTLPNPLVVSASSSTGFRVANNLTAASANFGSGGLVSTFTSAGNLASPKVAAAQLSVSSQATFGGTDPRGYGYVGISTFDAYGDLILDDIGGAYLQWGSAGSTSTLDLNGNIFMGPGDQIGMGGNLPALSGGAQIITGSVGMNKLTINTKTSNVQVPSLTIGDDSADSAMQLFSDFVGLGLSGNDTGGFDIYIASATGSVGIGRGHYSTLSQPAQSNALEVWGPALFGQVTAVQVQTGSIFWGPSPYSQGAGTDGSLSLIAKITAPSAYFTAAYLGTGTGISTFTSSGNLQVPGSVTAGSFTGSLSGGTNLPPSGIASGALPVGVTVSTANVSPGFNGNSELVQLTSGGALPAVSGANLTNLPASSKSGFLSANNGTLGVGTFSFGYTNQAVTISSMSVIVMVSGTGGSSGTVWACCYGGSCVSATSTQGAAIGSSYTGNGAVAVPAGGEIVLQMTSTGETTTPTVNAVCGYQ